MNQTPQEQLNARKRQLKLTHTFLEEADNHYKKVFWRNEIKRLEAIIKQMETEQ